MLLSALGLLLLAWGARPAPAKEAPTLGPPRGLVARVQAAFEQGDRAALARVADDLRTDAWVLAHELCLRGLHEAARALGLAATRPDLFPLQEYVATLSRRPPSVPLWLRRGELRRLAQAERWDDLLETLQARPVDPGRSTVVTVDIEHLRGTALTRFGRHGEAMKAFLQAGEAARVLGWWKGAVRSFKAGFEGACEERDPECMLRFKNRLLEVYQFSGDRRMAGRTLADIGSLLGNLAKYQDALLHYRRVLAEYADVLGPDARMHVLSMYGMAELNLGHYAKAQSLLLDALARARDRDHPNPQVEAVTLEWLGILMTQIGEYPDAAEYLDGARAIVTGSKDAGWLAEIDGNLGTLAMKRGRLDEARAVMERLADFYEEHDEPDYRAVALVNLAEIDRLEGRLDSARRRLQVVRRQVEPDGSPGVRAHLYGELSRTHRAQGDTQGARQFAKLALALAQETKSVRREVEGYANLAAIHVDRKEYDKAIATARSGARMLSFLFDRLPPAQSGSARRLTAALYAAGLEAALALGDVDEATFFLEGGRAGALLTTLDGRRHLRAAQVQPALLAEVVIARRLEAGARRALDAARRTGVLQAVGKAVRHYEEARRRHRHASQRVLLEASFAADLRYPLPATRKEIQASLADGETLVLYARSSDDLVAVVITQKTARLARLGSAVEAHRLCDGLQFDPDADVSQATLASLRALAVDGLEIPVGTQRLLVSPVGCLSYLPPVLLFPGIETTLVPSGTTYGRLKAYATQATGRVLALGDPEYGPPPPEWSRTLAVRAGNLVPLPGTRIEAQAVGDQVLLGPEASETRLRDLLAKRTHWRCIHLACHGLVNEERPSLSALALTPTAEDDGLLSVLDIAQLDVHADLVVLSACETARGRLVEAEGIVGLMRAFMGAGAANVLVSLWQVDDEASRALMIRFHELWNGDDPARRLGASAALRAAQAYVRDFAKNHGGKHPEWAHAHYWAAWQLWGPGR